MGSLILFDHGIWHAGETVTAGTKYIMRSDVLFRRVDSAITVLSEVAGRTADMYGGSLDSTISGLPAAAVTVRLERPGIEADLPAHASAIRCVHFIDNGTIATG